MTSLPGISCIICAFNEERTIGGLLSALTALPILKEIIVVDDGSTDRTAQIVRNHDRVVLVRHRPNRGKSAAVATGIAAAHHDLVMLLDADLVGVSARDIERLAMPVLSGAADVTLSLRGNSLSVYRLMGLDFVSGERVFPRAMLADRLDEIAGLPSFGFEAYFNRLLLERHLRIQVVYWKTVFNSRKAEKIGLWKGTVADIEMVADICRFIPPWEIVAQNYKLLSLTRPGRKRFARPAVSANIAGLWPWTR